MDINDIIGSDTEDAYRRIVEVLNNPKKSAESNLVDAIALTKHDPLAFAKIAYPWGKGDLASSSGPRDWQVTVLDTIGKHLRNPATRHTPLKIAIASGHGVGKSCLVSMIVGWGLSTVPGTRINVTASTENQLRTKTWPEVSKWARNMINAHWFETTATSMVSTQANIKTEWRADAIPWSENNTEAVAGLHNEGKRIILIFDEASAVADQVWVVGEGALTDANTEIIWLAFGNPTKNDGAFRECFGKFKHRWVTRQIDSRTVEGTNKTQIQTWIDDYGEDSDFVRVRVRGEFPRSGSLQFIPSDIVEAACERPPEAYPRDVRVMGVDVARFGDDASVICYRQGRDASSTPWDVYRGLDTMEFAAKIMAGAERFKPDAIFIDGGGVGGGVVDRLRMLRLPVIEVQFGAKADRAQDTLSGPVYYANKRAEMWGYMKDWLASGSIPDHPDLRDQLVQVQYGYVFKDGRDVILLEKKSDMKKRGLASSDMPDALALTFAHPIQPIDHTQDLRSLNAPTESYATYNPFSRAIARGIKR